MAALALVLRSAPNPQRLGYADTLDALQASLEQLLRVRGRTAYLSAELSSAAPARLQAQALGLMALSGGAAPPQLLPKLAAGLAGRGVELLFFPVLVVVFVLSGIHIPVHIQSVPH